MAEHSMNDDWIVQSVSAQVFRQYPELKGIHPDVHWTQNGETKRCSLIFQTTVKTATGKNLHRRIKVVTNADGKIQKISSSR